MQKHTRPINLVCATVIFLRQLHLKLQQPILLDKGPQVVRVFGNTAKSIFCERPQSNFIRLVVFKTCNAEF